MNTTTTRELHVIFGTGPVGKATARALIELGQRVRMVNRSGHAADLPAEVEVVKGDAYDPAFTTEVTRGAAAVYQCAQPEYHEWVTKFLPLQAAILEGAAANGAKLVVMENLYMYGDTDGQPICESLPYRAHTRKGKVRAQMAEALLAAHRAGTVRIAIGRASDFIGPEYDVMGEQVFYPALAGKAANALGDMDQPHSFTYIPDVGRALAILGTRDEALGRAWHIPSPEALTQRDLLQRIYAAAGQPFKARAASRWMVWLLGRFIPPVRETYEMMYEWEKPFIVDSSDFERTFGMKATPWETIIRESVDWFRAHPRSAAESPAAAPASAQS
jgi:nucleoside-diphosphate-sugar epimerase